MASGTNHDRCTRWGALPFGLLCWPLLGWGGLLAGSLGFLVGGLWLSPDLDTRSNPSRRWGPLAPLWAPYRKLVRHRGLLSHGPLLGSGLRLLYLSLLLLGFSLLLQPLGAPSPPTLWQGGIALWQHHQPLVVSALAGLEASAWLHLLQDGDPLPPPLRR
jgi:uncharacterized metal-binding protein